MNGKLVFAAYRICSYSHTFGFEMVCLNIFTTINCSTLNYGHCSECTVNGENLRTKQALYMTVSKDEVNLERLSFWTEDMIALTEGRKASRILRFAQNPAGRTGILKLAKKYTI